MEIEVCGRLVNVECVDEYGFDHITHLLEHTDLTTKFDEKGTGRYVLTAAEYERLEEYIINFERLRRLKETRAFAELSPQDKSSFEAVTDMQPEVQVGAQLAWLRFHGIV